MQKIYKHIDFLPVWNYYRVITEKDLRYLLKLDDYSELPDIDKNLILELSDIWKQLTYQFGGNDLNLNLIRLKAEAWETFLDYLTSDVEQKYNVAFAKYRKAYDGFYSNCIINDETLYNLFIEKISPEIIQKILRLKNVKFASFYDLYDEVKKYVTYPEILYIRLYLIDHVSTNNAKSFDLIEDKVNIELMLDGIIKIDVHNTTVAEYFKYKEKAIQKVRKIKNEKTRKKSGRN